MNIINVGDVDKQWGGRERLMNVAIGVTKPAKEGLCTVRVSACSKVGR